MYLIHTGIHLLILLLWREQEMKRLQRTIDDFNSRVYAPAGLYIRWPRDVGFLFVRRPGQILSRIPFS